MAGGRSVSFEVYYLQYGRWQIHHRYSMSERDDAINEAKRLDSGHFEAACVLRESYDASSGTSSEAVVYHTPTLKAKPPIASLTSGGSGGAPAAKPSGGGGGGRGPMKNAPPGSAAANAIAEMRKKAAAAKAAAKEAEARRPQPAPRTPPKTEVVEEPDWAKAVPKLLIAFIFACVVGTVAGILMYFGVKGLNSIGISLGKQLNQLVLVGAWLFGWLGTFVPLLRKILGGMGNRKQSGPSSLGRSANAGPAPLPPVTQEMAQQALSTAAKALDEKNPGAEPPALPEEDLPQEEILEEEPLDDPIEDDLDEDPEEPLPTPGAEDGMASLRASMVDLVQEAMQRTNNTVQSDQFLRFGIILFLAGAAESLARSHKVANRDVTTVLTEQIESLGVSPSMALGFAANIDEYLLDPRYFEMYSDGRAGALSKLNGGADSGMQPAIDKWRTPKAAPAQEESTAVAEESKHFDGKPGEEEAHGFVAVLFTDIVNSTKKQQENGDAWLMNVVRAHNDIVREAIAKHAGREIKHTGDGIMASFPAVQGSVESALLMQNGVQKFSEMMPELGFEICIGISAGEPIHESGDLFGTPVNLAARVLSKASAHETAVSNIVREMCRGKHFGFEELGRFDLKGFEDPVPIYKVVENRK